VFIGLIAAVLIGGCAAQRARAWYSGDVGVALSSRLVTESEEKKRPIMWDIYMQEQGGAMRWEDIQPLAAQMHSHARDHSMCDVDGASADAPVLPQSLLHRLRNWVKPAPLVPPSFVDRGSRRTLAIRRPPTLVKAQIQIGILIAMPSPRAESDWSRPRDQHRGHIPEGSTSVEKTVARCAGEIQERPRLEPARGVEKSAGTEALARPEEMLYYELGVAHVPVALSVPFA